MRKKLVLLLTCVACLFAGGAAGAAMAETAEPADTRWNILPNGSFEETIAQTENNYELQWGAQQYTATGTAQNVRTGSKSILLACEKGRAAPPFAKNTSFFDRYTLPLVTYGEEYELSMWFRATDGFRGYGFLRLFYNTDQDFGRVDDQNVAFANNESNVEDVWTKVSYRFTLNGSYDANGTPTKVTGLRFVFFEMNVIESGNLYLDDVSLCRVSPELAAGQTDSVDGLDVTAGEPSFAYAGLEAEVDADPAHAVADTGGASLKVNATGNDGNLYRFLDRAQFAKDIYVFSFYVRGAGVWRATGAYPDGLVVLPTIARDNDVFAFPENLLYGTASFRKYMQGYLPGLMRENGQLCGNGGLTLPTSEAEKTDFDWVKVEIPFNPYGLPDGATGEDGSKTYTDEQVTQICLMIRMTGVTGTLWFDDFKVYRAGTAEPEYLKSAKLAVDGTSPALIAYGQAYTFPTATARGLGESGEYDVDLDADIKVTLEHKRELSAGVEGWYVYPDHEKLAIGEAARTFTPDWHGYYRLRYEVTHRGETVATYFNADVQDTLTAISVNLSGVVKEIRYGDELDLSALTVTKTMSYTGEQPVSEGWTVDLGGYTTASAPGNYTVTVSYAEPYGGTKTDSFAVTVTDYATAFRMKTPPTKLTYAYGEDFDKSGLTAEVTLAYGGLQTLGAAELDIVGYDAQKVGAQSVKARFGNMEGKAFSVTVEDALSAVVVDTEDVKKSYTVGEPLDLSGLVVRKVMKSGERVTLTAQDYTVEYGGYTTESPAGSYTLTVKVTEGSLEKSASFEVEVRAKADGGKGGCGGAAASLFALLAIVGAGLVKFR